MSHQPRKRFGQNFLTDDTIIHLICQCIAPQEHQHIVEIGPGHGAISKPILQQVGKLTVIELDKDLIPLLTTALTPLGDVQIIQHDALCYNFSELATQAHGPLRIIGNLPYNISTPLLFHLLQYKEIIHDMNFMLQKEVVDRICAQPCTKAYGRLSVMLQYACQVELLLDIPPDAFFPKPKVNSAFFRLTPHPSGPISPVKDLMFFEKVVRLSFSQRRKTLANCLKPLLNQSVKSKLDCDLTKRAEQLSVQDFVNLANELFLA